MAKKVSNNTINNAQTDWSRDESNNGWPYSGQSIQEYIRRRLSLLEDNEGNAANKFGAVYFDSDTNSLLFFKDDEDKQAYIENPELSELIIDSMILTVDSGVDYMVALSTDNAVSGQDNNIQISVNEEHLVLILNYSVNKIVGNTMTVTGQPVRFYLEVIDPRGNVTTLTPTKQVWYPTIDRKFTFDIRESLQIGRSTVIVHAMMESNHTIEHTFTYTINVSELYIQLPRIETGVNTWYQPIVEHPDFYSTYKLGGFIIIGGMDKVLNIDIKQGNDNDVQHFEILIDANTSYPELNPYNFTHAIAQTDVTEPFNMLKGNKTPATGIYTVVAYLTSGNLTSNEVSYDFMYVRAEDKDSAQLICVNSKADVAYNYSANTLCYYSVYDKGRQKTTIYNTLNFVTSSTPTPVILNKPIENIDTGVSLRYDYNIAWLVTQSQISLYAELDLYFLENSERVSAQFIRVPIDNSATYPAERDAVLYIDSSTRRNSDSNREKLRNEAVYPAVEFEPTWEKMSWVDGIDGWTTDDAGRRCLLIPAKSSMTLSGNTFQILGNAPQTIEICFKVLNVADYDENIITIAQNPAAANFRGIRIRPTNVTVHNDSSVDDSQDFARGTNFTDEEVHHLLITMGRYGSGTRPKNIVSGYIDGSIAFQFDYNDSAVWSYNVPLIIGSQYSDICIYFIRKYNTFFEKASAEKNYINSLETIALREQKSEDFYSIVKNTTHAITYENVVKANKNFFVVEMLNGRTIPSLANGWSDKSPKALSNLEMHFGDNPLWDFKIYGVATEGQGTTSMNYYRWNIKFRIDDKDYVPNKEAYVAYYSIPTTEGDTKTYNELPKTKQKSVYFDGGANNIIQNHPKVSRITAKINFASSMQSHKIGATRAYDALRNELEIQNEAQLYAVADENNLLPKPTVAVYQYPAYGFSKTQNAQGEDQYEYIGLFTIGPDKGDKSTFGYDINNDIKNHLITMEGPDHTRRLTKFLHPWDENVKFLSSEESLCITKGNVLDDGWEVGQCYGYDSEIIEDEENILAALEREFKPAYEVIYKNSTQIFPVERGNLNAAQKLQEINSDVTNFRKIVYAANPRFTYTDMEFWIEDEYILYYYDDVEGEFLPGVNLVTDLGILPEELENLTLNQKNELFKQRRRERYKANVRNYWNIEDAIYHFLFVLWFGATDNFAKNTYPYKMADLSQGGRWMWRQDDLDTIFDIDNLGKQTKNFDIEFDDGNAGFPIFAGSTSVFWNLLYEVFWENDGNRKGIKALGKEFIEKMAKLGQDNNIYTGCSKFIKEFFLDNAQYYFNEASYNEDATYKYEAAWITDGQTSDALAQSLGNHLSAELLWTNRRIIYMMSLFQAGAFGTDRDNSLGNIKFRPKDVPSLSFTPIMTLYPALMNGSGAPETTSRTNANIAKTFEGFPNDGQTTYTIQATDYLTYLGDWKNIKLGYYETIKIFGKKLKIFNIGDAISTNVTTDIPSLEFNNNKCLETINARNASSISGEIDLSSCTRLVSADFRGTSITRVTLPSGSKIEHLYLSDETKAIVLKNLKFLNDLELPSQSKLKDIHTIRVEECTYQDALGMLRTLYNQDNSALQYIRLIWDGNVSGYASDITMLANIHNQLDKNNVRVVNDYQGIRQDDTLGGTPTIEGTILLESTGLYSDDLEVLGNQHTEDLGNNLVKVQTEVFGTLYVIYDTTRVYIRFVDSIIEDKCVAKWSGDGVGLTMSDAAAVVVGGFGNQGSEQFNNNFIVRDASITKFNEFKYFTGLTIIPSTNSGSNSWGMCSGCTNLEEITLPSTIKDLGYASFSGCSNLEKVIGDTGCKPTTIHERCFLNCYKLKDIPDLSQVTSIGYGAFRGCSELGDINLPSLVTFSDTSQFILSGVTNVLSLGSITALPDGSGNEGIFRQCTRLESVILPNSLITIGSYSFVGCTNLENVTFNSNIQTIGNSAFDGCSKLLGDLNFPNLISIGQNAFLGCTSLTSIVSLGSITTLAHGSGNSGVFRGCAGLTAVTLPTSLTQLGSYTFAGCSNLESVDFSNAACSVGGYAFNSCSKLETISNYSNIVSFGTNCFQGCSSFSIELTTNSLPDVVSVENSAFVNRTGVTGTLSLPSLTTIGAESFRNTRISSISSLGEITDLRGSAFRDCSQLTSVILPSTLTVIRDYVFANDTNLVSANIPSALTRIENAAFYFTNITTDISNLRLLEYIGADAFNGTSIQGDLNCPSLTTLGGSAFKGTNITSVTSLGTITTLTNSANNDESGPFTRCTSLVSVVLPNTLTTIGRGTFNGCTNLSSINIPTSVTTIGRFAFGNCSSLSGTLTISQPITIEYCAFRRAGYSKVIFEDNITISGGTLDNGTLAMPNLTAIEFSANQVDSLIGYLFGGQGNTLLTATFKSVIPPTINMYTFNGVNHSLQHIYVPAESVDAYKEAWGSLLRATSNGGLSEDTISAIPSE